MVDHAVALEEGSPGELRGHDLEGEVTKTRGAPGVALVQGRIVPEGDPASGKGLGEMGLERRGGFRGAVASGRAHGSAWRNGREEGVDLNRTEKAGFLVGILFDPVLGFLTGGEVGDDQAAAASGRQHFGNRMAEEGSGNQQPALVQKPVQPLEVPITPLRAFPAPVGMILGPECEPHVDYLKVG